MLNIGIGRKYNRKIKFYINSKRSLAFVRSLKSSIFNHQEQKGYVQTGRILYVFDEGV